MPVDDSIRYIPLSQGKTAIVDAADYEFLMQWKWHVIFKKHGSRWYAGRISPETSRTILMHRLLLNAPAHLQVDHKDGDGLNNCRSNIRLATHAENRRNCGPWRKGTSGAKGVSWFKQYSKWQARITVNRVSIHLGYFIEKSDAIAAYAEAAKKHHGDFARTEPFNREKVRGSTVATPKEKVNA